MESLLQKDFFVNILIFIIKRYPILTELILDSITVNDLIRISVLDTIPKNPKKNSLLSVLLDRNYSFI